MLGEVVKRPSCMKTGSNKTKLNRDRKKEDTEFKKKPINL